MFPGGPGADRMPKKDISPLKQLPPLLIRERGIVEWRRPVMALVVGGSPAHPQAKYEECECSKPNYEIEYPSTH